MIKLFVAGCSFSDYTKVEKCYGHLLAEKLNCEYVHEGAGCGSNWRIWRKLTGHIMTGNLTHKDILIVQYSEKSRNEFWTKFDQPPIAFEPRTVEHLPLVEKYKDGGCIIRYKSNGYWWQYNKEERLFFKAYEDNFISPDFDKERFEAHNYMFQNLLLQKGIKPIFIQSIRYPIDEAHILPEFKKYVFTEPLNKEELMKYNLAPDDMGHMSQEGHDVFSDWLLEHIKAINFEE